jgi:hypothetical protein
LRLAALLAKSRLTLNFERKLRIGRHTGRSLVPATFTREAGGLVAVALLTAWQLCRRVGTERQLVKAALRQLLEYRLAMRARVHMARDFNLLGRASRFIQELTKGFAGWA